MKHAMHMHERVRSAKITRTLFLIFSQVTLNYGFLLAVMYHVMNINGLLVSVSEGESGLKGLKLTPSR
jgi:hypothetical protein